MNRIEIYTKPTCPYCIAAKSVLIHMGLSFDEYQIDCDPARRAEMIKRSKQFTVPQIFINDQGIGGYDDLVELIETGEFSALIDESGIGANNQVNNIYEDVQNAA